MKILLAASLFVLISTSASAEAPLKPEGVVSGLNNICRAQAGVVIKVPDQNSNQWRCVMAGAEAALDVEITSNGGAVRGDLVTLVDQEKELEKVFLRIEDLCTFDHFGDFKITNRQLPEGKETLAVCREGGGGMVSFKTLQARDRIVFQMQYKNAEAKK
jgi:hypothetical protein